MARTNSVEEGNGVVEQNPPQINMQKEDELSLHGVGFYEGVTVKKPIKLERKAQIFAYGTIVSILEFYQPNSLTVRVLKRVPSSWRMSSAQDPFYIVKEEIQDSIDKLLSTFHQWERTSDIEEQMHLTKELLAGCESIEWQVDELDKTISVAARDPSWYGIDEAELDKRRRWTSTARSQVGNVKKTVVTGNAGNQNGTTTTMSGMRRELMRLQNAHEADKSNPYSQENDDYIQSESDRQMLLIRQQDEELDELSASVERIGGVGLTIHEELLAQEKIIDDLGTEMDSTSNRLDFVQKKVAMVMKKASVKGQIMMIAFLLLLFIILFVLVFLT